MKNKVYSADEIIRLYDDMPHFWLLLEVLDYDKNGRVKQMKLLSYSKNKEELYELLMEDENLDMDKKHLFVFTDPNSPCILDYSKP